MPPTTKTEKEEENKETESDTIATNVDEANDVDTDPTNEAGVHKTDLVTSTVATDLATPRLVLDDGWVMAASVVATETEVGHMTWKVCFDVYIIKFVYILHLHTSFVRQTLQWLHVQELMTKE